MNNLVYPILNGDNIITDTLYPVYNFNGFAGDGVLIVYNTEKNEFYMAWDGPWGRDRFYMEFGYYKYKNKNESTYHKVGEFPDSGWNDFYHTVEITDTNKKYTNVFYRFPYDKDIPNPNIDLIKQDVSFDKPLGSRAKIFTTVLNAAGGKYGPWRIYDNINKKWTSCILYKLDDNNGDVWHPHWGGSNPVTIQFGINLTKVPDLPNIISTDIQTFYLGKDNTDSTSFGLWHNTVYGDALKAVYKRLRDLIGPCNEVIDIYYISISQSTKIVNNINYLPSNKEAI